MYLYEHRINAPHHSTTTLEVEKHSDGDHSLRTVKFLTFPDISSQHSYLCCAQAPIHLQHCGGSKEITRPEAQRPKKRSTKGWQGSGFGRGMFPSPPARVPGEHCKLPQWGLGQSPSDLAI